MLTRTIYFPPDRQTPCVFPYKLSNLTQAISQLGLKGRYPVIVLVGDNIENKHVQVTRQVIDTICMIAQDLKAAVICGGTTMGITAEIGLRRRRNHQSFPLIGIAPHDLVSWPSGPQSTKFFWWGKTRSKLDPHYSHFILVPGSQFGDEIPWINDTATLLSKDHRSVTVLLNGGKVARSAVALSLETGRPVIAVSGTGRLADELAGEAQQDVLITVIPANAEQQLVEALQTRLSTPALFPRVDQYSPI
jgi:type III secretion system FlhB-like substrate exporter